MLTFRHMNIAKQMLTTFNYDPDLLKKVITGDKLWMHAKTEKLMSSSVKYDSFASCFLRV